MVWQRFAKSPRVACAGSSPAASAKVSVVRSSDSTGGCQRSSLTAGNPGPVAQRNKSATLRRSRSHVQIVPGPPLKKREEHADLRNADLDGGARTDRLASFRVRKEEPVLEDQKRRWMARNRCWRHDARKLCDEARTRLSRSVPPASTCVPEDYGVAELERRESLKLVYVGSNPTSVASFEKVDAEYTGVVRYHSTLSIANCRFPIDLFSGTPGKGNQIGNRQSKIGNAFARVMQFGRHRKLKPSVLEVRILSRVPNQINFARVAQLEEAADLRPAL